MFFLIGILKNFAILEPSFRLSFTEHLRELLLDFCSSKYLFQLYVLETVESVFVRYSFENAN